MKDAEIEAWALRIADNISSGAHGEHDDRVECKREWPDPVRVARRLAAHANGARGQEILWLVGIDEQTGPVSCPAIELSSWWPAVEVRFNGIAPTLARHMPVVWAGKPFTALLFETHRAPFVVRAEDPGDDRLEVPWRDGTRTRSARRDELLRILLPPLKIPTLELLDGDFEVSVPKSENQQWLLTLQLQMYAHAAFDSVVVVPDHRCQASVFDGARQIADLEHARLSAHLVFPGAGSHPNRREPASRLETVHAGDHQVIITGPGRFTAGAHLYADNSQWSSDDEFPSVLQTRFVLHPIDLDVPMNIAATLVREEPPTDGGGAYEHIVRWIATAG